MSEQQQPTSERPQNDDGGNTRRGAEARRTAPLLVLLVLVLAGGAFYYLWNMRAAPSTTEGIRTPASRTTADGMGEAGATGIAGRNAAAVVDADNTLNVLLLGVTDREARATVDAIVVVSFRPKSKTVAALALPANTVLTQTADAATHLQDVYADGDRAALTLALERLLETTIHHTVRIDFVGFAKLVDLFGGVPVDVASEVTYRDAQGRSVFHLEPGVQRLNGEQALLYVRYKGPEDEGRRMERQWQFIEDAVAEAQTQLGWGKVQPLLSIAFNHISTDLDLAGVTKLVRTVYDADRSDYALHMLPGADGDEGWIVDADQFALLRRDVFTSPSGRTAAP